MANAPSYDPDKFNRFEQDGWRVAAGGYVEVFDALTAQAVPSLLEAVDATPASRLLDIACGPGALTAAAAARGLEAIGIDYVDEVVAVASRRHAGIRFQIGNAEALDFEGDSFDAVTCSFGLLHFGHPERAIAEAYRVLKAGGRYAITAWIPSQDTTLFSLVNAAFMAHAELSEPLPAGPDFFQFGRVETARSALAAAGFQRIRTRELGLVARFEAPHAMLDALARSSVRTRGMIQRLTASSRANVQSAVVEGSQAFVTARGVELPCPALLTVGHKS